MSDVTLTLENESQYQVSYWDCSSSFHFPEFRTPGADGEEQVEANRTKKTANPNHDNCVSDTFTARSECKVPLSCGVVLCIKVQLPPLWGKLLQVSAMSSKLHRECCLHYKHLVPCHARNAGAVVMPHGFHTFTVSPLDIPVCAFLPTAPFWK